MALKIPNLDERKYESILEDAKKRIPIYTKEWTDHNIHDPGITFLELLVWLAEMQIYHLDQITDRHYLKYLKLLGFAPRPQRCTSVDITFDLDGDEGGFIIIPGGEQIISIDESGKELVFETSKMLAVSGAKITRVISDYPRGREDNTESNNKAGIYFLVFGTKAEEDSCMYIGFDKSPLPFNSIVKTLDIVIQYYENNLDPPASHGDEAEDISISVKVVWQYCINYDKWYMEDSWADFELEEDTTMMLTRKGVVVLKKPENWLELEKSGTIFNDEESYFWIRCKVVKKGYEIPPQIDAAMINTVSAVHKMTIENEILKRVDDLVLDKYLFSWDDISGNDNGRLKEFLKQDFSIDWVKTAKIEKIDNGKTIKVSTEKNNLSLKLNDEQTEVNLEIDDDRTDKFVVKVENSKLNIYLDKNTSTGLPNQRFCFGSSPVIDARIVIDGIKWTGVTDFDGSGHDDTHYLLDRDRGEITFGDGISGRIPHADNQVKAEIYCSGGGIVGNIKSNSVWELKDEAYSGISLSNKFKAAGGADAESIESALVRLKKDLKVPYRGVTLDDYSHIATHTPGLRFGRAGCVNKEITENEQDFHKIQVVVVPYSTMGKPVPSQGFIDTVLHHLNRHRLLTDRIEVKGPEYVGIGVKASVNIISSYSHKGRKSKINETLNEFLNPLTGGEDGKGWPFGRTVYISEIYSLLENVEGVECVLSVNLESTEKRVDKEGNIGVDEDALVYSTNHQITIVTRDERCGGDF